MLKRNIFKLFDCPVGSWSVQRVFLTNAVFYQANFKSLSSNLNYACLLTLTDLMMT